MTDPNEETQEIHGNGKVAIALHAQRLNQIDEKLGGIKDTQGKMWESINSLRDQVVEWRGAAKFAGIVWGLVAGVAGSVVVGLILRNMGV